MKPGIVLDKDYLHGASRLCIAALAKDHRLVMSSALFFELMTSTERKRRQCFAKLQPEDNPVDLVEHIGILLRREIETAFPCGRPSEHKLDLKFRFNPQLLDEGYVLPAETASALEGQSMDIDGDRDRLIELSELTPSLFPKIIKGTTEELLTARQEAEAAIADHEEILQFYGKLESPDKSLPFPSPKIVNVNWAHIRWLQVKMLFALDLYVRYQGRIRAYLTPKVLERIEHDVLDAQHLALGLLEGAFATGEKKLCKWWKLLKPEGMLFTYAT